MAKAEIWAILVAGGSGSRYHAEKSKLLERLHGKTILQRSAEALLSLPNLKGLCVVYHPDWLNDYQEALGALSLNRPILWAAGGESRRQSVWNGLQCLPATAEIVMIHDAARPLVKRHYAQAVLEPVIKQQALGTSLGVPCTNTIKQATPGDIPWVDKTIPRTILWQVHTPQVFLKTALLNAHLSVSQDAPVTDDAELLEHAYPGQHVVQMVMDSPYNVKITTPFDVVVAEALLSKEKTFD